MSIERAYKMCGECYANSEIANNPASGANDLVALGIWQAKYEELSLKANNYAMRALEDECSKDPNSMYRAMAAQKGLEACMACDKSKPRIKEAIDESSRSRE